MSATSAAQHSSIGIFLRVKPVTRPAAGLSVNETDQQIYFNLPRSASSGYDTEATVQQFIVMQPVFFLNLECLSRLVNNQRENYQFAFNGVLAAQAKQEEVSIFRAELTWLLVPIRCNGIIIVNGSFWKS